MSRISATGMNALELEQNVQLTDFEPRNLNIEPKLPYKDESFDVVTCVVSVDYLIHPLGVFREGARVESASNASRTLAKLAILYAPDRSLPHSCYSVPERRLPMAPIWPHFVMALIVSRHLRGTYCVVCSMSQ